jgi:hypothetical protein
MNTPTESLTLNPVFGDASQYANPSTAPLLLGGLPAGLGAMIAHTETDDPDPRTDSPWFNVEDAHVVVNDKVLFWLSQPVTQDAA